MKASAISFVPVVGLGEPTAILSYGKNETMLIPEAVPQFLNHVVGSGAPAVWRFVTGSPTRDRQFMADKAKEMFDKSISTTRKNILVHKIAGEGWGITSPNYKKVYDYDVLTAGLEYGGEDNFYRLYHTPGRTAADFRINDFHDPSGKLYYTLVRMENNQWGRHSLSLKPAIVRQVCSNGAVVPVMKLGSISVRHIGDINLGATRDYFANVKQESDVFSNIINKSFGQKVPLEPYLQKVMTTHRIPKKDMVGVERYLRLEDNPATLYSVANAVSRLANDYDGERRLDLQVIAGKIYTDF